MGVAVAVAPPAHVLLRAVFGGRGFESRGRVLAALVGVHDETSRRAAHDQGATKRFADQVFGHRVAHVPAHNLARTAVEPHGQLEPAPALAGRVRDVADPDPVRGSRGRVA